MIRKQHGCGSVPGGLSREAGELMHPKVDPARERLAKVKYAVGCTSGFGDFTYRKLNRRRRRAGWYWCPAPGHHSFPSIVSPSLRLPSRRWVSASIE